MNIANDMQVKQEDTKRKIERAALKLFVRRGIDIATTKEIAAAAGIAEGTIYRHFVSKDELAQSLFLTQHIKLAEAIEIAHRPYHTLWQKIPAIVECYCRAADSDWLLFSYHLLSMHLFLSRMPKNMPNPVTVVRTVLANATAKNEITSHDLELTTAMVLGLILQPAFHKVYGALEGDLVSHKSQFSQAIVQVLRLST